MRTKIIRVAEGKQSTLSQLYIDDIFQCYLLEDKIRDVKIPKQTAIPKGNYTLRLNTWGGMNAEYRQKFPKFHKGMIEINGLPNFSFVYIHIGNTYRQTAGCPLCGFGFEMVNGDYQVLRSKDAYQMIYPKLLALAQDQHNGISIENNFQF
ncbi:hypothetical protein SAMN05421741_102114 [Paenimyroides ummariense]|uniref:DUF5675 domain-containing protein n=1 Tax=Paenimyroides ummariense TaxID=913024 RepID=A0A1I4X5P6_9FLAO|nr:DUF5675 family protein [Paenimyroides ummariense]SFN20833.1 hypothetical protein SAMN05421741_102114 [Paenimyroides ummariense]